MIDFTRNVYSLYLYEGRKKYRNEQQKVLFSLNYHATDTSLSLVQLLVYSSGLRRSRCHITISNNPHRWSFSDSFDYTDIGPSYSKPVHFPSNG